MNKFELAAGVLGVYKRKDRRIGSARFWCDNNCSDCIIIREPFKNVLADFVH